MQTWAQVLTCIGEDVSFTDVKIKIPDRKFYQGVWMASCTGSARRIWGFWKKSVCWVLPWDKTVDFRLLAVALCRVHTWCGGGRWKSQVYLSPYVEKPFNSKVIKKFRTWVVECFSYFGIPMFYLYMLWTFYVRFNIHVWLCNKYRRRKTEF